MKLSFIFIFYIKYVAKIEDVHMYYLFFSFAEVTLVYHMYACAFCISLILIYPYVWFDSLFSVIFFVCMFTFFASQILPKVLDIIMPLNESRPCELLGLATLFFDQEKYFVPILIHMFTALFVELCTLVATEAMLIIYMQHCCALFKIAR